MTPHIEQYLARRDQVAFILNEFILQHLWRVYHAFDGDIESALILGEIGHYNTRGILGDESQGESLTQEQLANRLHELKRCNALSISMATGIPRETTRRKILKMERKGWLQRDAHGGIVVSPTVADHFEGFNLEALTHMLAASDDLRRILGKAADDLEFSGEGEA